MLDIKWLSTKDDYTVNDDGASWEENGKFFYYDANGCWETSELIDVNNFNLKNGEIYYKNEVVADFLNKVILQEVDFNHLNNVLKKNESFAIEPKVVNNKHYKNKQKNKTNGFSK